eukprot:1787468-Prymnesium_polylepis.1
MGLEGVEAAVMSGRALAEALIPLLCRNGPDPPPSHVPYTRGGTPRLRPSASTAVGAAAGAPPRPSEISPTEYSTDYRARTPSLLPLRAWAWRLGARPGRGSVIYSTQKAVWCASAIRTALASQPAPSPAARPLCSRSSRGWHGFSRF